MKKRYAHSFLIDKVGKNYSALFQIEYIAVRNPSEFVGNLEILALSFHSKYVSMKKLETKCFVCGLMLPVDCNNWPIKHVSYRMDAEQQAGHFDLLIKNLCPVTCESVLRNFIRNSEFMVLKEIKLSL